MILGKIQLYQAELGKRDSETQDSFFFCSKFLLKKSIFLLLISLLT